MKNIFWQKNKGNIQNIDGNLYEVRDVYPLTTCILYWILCASKSHLQKFYPEDLQIDDFAINKEEIQIKAE